MLIFFISSGIFLGLVLGFQDLSVIYESVQGKRRSKSIWKILAVIGALSLGVMLNRQGTSTFISNLAHVADFRAGFLILFAASLTVIVLKQFFRFSSISQTVIGAIFGWLWFNHHTFPTTQFVYIIFVWMLAPLLSFALAHQFLSLSKWIIKRSKIHIFKIDFIFQTLTFIAALFAVFSFGANTVANVEGVFLNAVSGHSLQFFDWIFPAEIALFVVAFFSIAVGFIFSHFYFSRWKETSIFMLSPEVNLSVLASFTVVFFLFSSQMLQSILHHIGLAGYQLVPLNTFFILTGSLVGISIKDGFKIYSRKAFGNIAINAIVTPVIAGLTSFVFFIGIQKFVGEPDFWKESYSKVEAIDLGQLKAPYPGNIIEIVETETAFNLVIIGVFVAVLLIGVFFFYRMRSRLQKEQQQFKKQASALETEKEFFVEKLKYEEKAGERLKNEVELRNHELEKFALQLIEKEKILASTKTVLNKLRNEKDETQRKELVDKVSFIIADSLNLTKEREMFYSRVTNVQSDFIIRISQQFTLLTENDKRLIALLKLGLSSKEIAALFSITTKSVEMNRYRLRKKLNITGDQNLVEFINDI
jgi:phosphate/sulfate permease/DNA-binding CsgD family transcriptional regulator